ncbi:MAG: hypothetical protein H6810_08965 [Phycisphaeraceae bacterium]|nr:MAG: hypothetical protein H6810_08965 [Phycisphaeraceae bacterium]
MPRSILLLVLGLVGFFVGSGLGEPVDAFDGRERTLAAPDADDGFVFAVVGDCVPGKESGLGVLRRAVETLNLLDVRFVVTTGNMLQGDTDAAKWKDRVGAYRSVMNSLNRPWYPTPGPLDTAVRGVSRDEARTMYRSAFGPMSYSFDSGWAHVVVLSGELLSDRGGERERLLSWLAADLRGSDAEQVFVFIHDPMWRGDSAPLWEGVQQTLSAKLKPTRVISGGTLYAQGSEQTDNVKYYSVSTTGAYGSETHGYASSDSIALVRVRHGDPQISIVPFDMASSIDLFPASDAAAVRSLAETGWASVEGFVQAGAEAGDGAGFEIALENPTPVRIGFDAEVLAPDGWVFNEQRISGTVEPGQTRRLAVRAEAPALVQGERPDVRVVVTGRYPLAGGGEQAVIRRLDVPVRPRGAEERAAATPDANGVLSLSGRGAVRVELGDRPWRFTTECWVKGDQLSGTSTVLSRFRDDKGFGLTWSKPGGVLPYGIVGTDRGLAWASLDTPPAWGEWHHVALTYDGKRAVVYLDGVEAARSETAGSAAYSDLPLYIGAEPNERGDPIGLFVGEIDEVRVSSVVRYTGSFTPEKVFGPDESTLLLLHFDTDYLGAHPDDSGRGRHGWSVGSKGAVQVVREQR